MAAPAAETGLGSSDAGGTEAAKLDAEEPEDVVAGKSPQPEISNPAGTVAMELPDVAISPPSGWDVATATAAPSVRDIATATPQLMQEIATPTPGSRSRRSAGQTNR